ncbi:MAG: potassium transporter Kef [Acidobacteria bacterium]|nr:potassium transporter Kef [Acidobacteriota bacterium]
MDIAIAARDVAWIALAFVLGLVSRTVGLPPLVGYLAAGFLLNLHGTAGGEMLQRLSDLGITLLLFLVGLKLDLRTIARPHVWAVASLHMSIVVLVLGAAIHVLALLGASFLTGIGFSQALLIAFALSFSSTVFVVKVLEERGETVSLHGRIAVGILIVQDLAAVVFLALAAGELPTVRALLLLILIPLRPLLALVLQRVGHGELLVLYGFLLALGGAEAFELAGLKGDLGALVVGVLIASHDKADELAKTMLGFKDLFLVGFFLSIGVSGPLTTEVVLIGAAITPFVFFKSALFLGLLAGFKLRARTSLLASLNLTNFSEFGLIVAAVGVANGWIDGLWLSVIAVALSLSCGVAAAVNAVADRIYTRYRATCRRLERRERLADDRPLDTGGATTLVLGMGRIGAGAYEAMHRRPGETVVGVDIDPRTVANHRSAGFDVLLGDPSDADFWDRVQDTNTVELVMLALPNLTAGLAVLNQLRAASFRGRIAATARFHDEIEPLERAGASVVFSVYEKAGSGFAEHVAAQDATRRPA